MSLWPHTLATELKDVQHSGDRVDRIGNKVDCFGDNVDLEKLSNSSCCRLSPKPATKSTVSATVDFVADVSPVSATVDFVTSVCRALTATSRYVFYLSVHPFDRPLPNLCTWYFENKWTKFGVHWYKWSVGKGHETVNFRDGRQWKVKVTWRWNTSQNAFQQDMSETVRQILTKHGRHILQLMPIVLHQLRWQRSNEAKDRFVSLVKASFWTLCVESLFQFIVDGRTRVICNQATEVYNQYTWVSFPSAG